MHSACTLSLATLCANPNEFVLAGSLHKKQQRPAAWTASPLTEGEAVQSVHLCFQSNNLQWLTQN